ncbi:hypothetical protein L195_g047906 [Trifolium pratense]|uniref:Uncharacterized protein n=1 Tax=Trifolium pratense TaxID=57577 RepID=A0A2K3MLV8_TRIPR|nr:hypothetical protein L195_g047906 [Trifolium pratense]
MFSFFLIVTGRNLSPSPPSLDINFGDPPVQHTLPPPTPYDSFDFPPVQTTLSPPSPIVNGGDVFQDIKNLKSKILVSQAITLLVLACI